MEAVCRQQICAGADGRRGRCPGGREVCPGERYRWGPSHACHSQGVAQERGVKTLLKPKIHGASGCHKGRASNACLKRPCQRATGVLLRICPKGLSACAPPLCLVVVFFILPLSPAVLCLCSCSRTDATSMAHRLYCSPSTIVLLCTVVHQLDCCRILNEQEAQPAGRIPKRGIQRKRERGN